MNNNQAHDRLRELLDGDPLDPTVDLRAAASPDDTGLEEGGDRLIDQALSLATLSALSPEAQELLIGLADTASSLEPAARHRLVVAADRGMKRRREDASPLPRLLFVVRNRENRSLDAVAASLKADDDLLSKIERGETSVKELGPQGVASWIQLFGVPNDVAIEALRLTFIHADPDLAAAGARAELSEEHNRFVGEVSDLLQER